jgi:hypothetical protein
MDKQETAMSTQPVYREYLPCGCIVQHMDAYQWMSVQCDSHAAQHADAFAAAQLDRDTTEPRYWPCEANDGGEC